MRLELLKVFMSTTYENLAIRTYVESNITLILFFQLLRKVLSSRGYLLDDCADLFHDVPRYDIVLCFNFIEHIQTLLSLFKPSNQK